LILTRFPFINISTSLTKILCKCKIKKDVFLVFVENYFKNRKLAKNFLMYFKAHSLPSKLAKKKSLIFFFLLMILIFNSCKKETNTAKINDTNSLFKSSIKYAKGFDIQVYNDYKKLIIKAPYPNAENQQEFILVSKNTSNKIDKKIENSIAVPLTKIVATSTTHIPMLEFIGEEKSLIGFPNTDFISSVKTRELIKKGSVKDIGNEQDFNTEVLLSLQPDAVIGFTMGNTTKMYNLISKNGIPVIFNGEWLEETPLGRAEWIKLFGALFDKDKIADSLFTDIETKYKNAIQIAKNSSTIPTIMTGILYKDKWNLPAGESFTAQLFKDANTNYLWGDTNGQGSVVLSFESVLDKAKNAEFWLGAGYFTSYSALEEGNSHYTKFDAFDAKKIYTFSKKRGENGGVLFFELAPMQPHIVLQDIIKITHPELLPDYEPFFLEKFEP
jgi:iron complex transport system substrate-binding protein